MSKNTVKKLVSAALCVALGLLLPQVFHVFGAGTVFLPMHIPVLLCGFICGWQYGLACGLIVPLLSSVTTGMPPIFPVAIAMMFELGAYGALSGFLYRRTSVYPALIGAMLGGRVVSGLANAILMGFAGRAYGIQAFLAGAFVTALPGIVIQLVVIPLLVFALQRAGLTDKAQHAQTASK